MIVEVRTYRIKNGLRDAFLEFFRTRAVPLQRSLGMRIAGPFVDLEDADTFVWMRGFPSMEERDRMKDALYEGREWLDELAAIALPMLESYDVHVTEIRPGFVDEFESNPPDPLME